jgi:hypothetical protein
MKIIKIVTDSSEIWRILKKIDWPTTKPEFDEPQDLAEWNICQLMSESEMNLCQLVPGTADGFPEEYDLPHISGPDPPNYQFEDYIDPPHWEDPNFTQYD